MERKVPPVERRATEEHNHKYAAQVDPESWVTTGVSPPAELRGRRLLLARTAWVAVVLLTTILFVASIPAYFWALYEVCRAGPCIGGQLSSAEMAVLAGSGLSISFYASYVLALDLLVAVGFCSVGAVLFWRRSRDRGALFASFALVMFGLTWPGIFEAVKLLSPWGEPVGRFLFDLGLASLVVLLLVFPDGRFVPRWTRWLAAFALVQLISSVLFPGSFLVDPPQVINVTAFVGLWAICAFAQAYRYARVSGPVERQQVKWLVFGVAALVALLGAFFLPLVFFPKLGQPGLPSLYYDLAGRALAGSFAFLLIPLSIGVAILRYRLYDIDIVVNRTLVYATLTVSLATIYLGSVVLLEQLLSVLTGQGSQLAVVASTLVIAAAFSPLRHRVQNLIDRRFYRRKYDARKTLEAFSAKLKEDVDLDALGDDLVGVIRETMQPDHVSLWLRPGGSTQKGGRTDQQPLMIRSP